ncbi:GNAT family N-acetyltransferase [Candidatus Pantoea multigeneris]|uniref:GNAT family N-acetyltransferase n=1 Tax=Candidatus Pantoea multigeneris TaxID=2608357 RepID=A0ABX0R9P4_9GAMM|nr:GNAT family N-acetyltransferase [Pantoea multigeneris]NIF21807.1 GNAT family N-acetyltransferase [Pantoea multigeneris]
MSSLNIADQQWQQDEFEISTCRERLDIDWIHHQLAERSYWAKGQPRAKTERAIAGALPFGLYYQQQQIGFARLITDYTRFGWLCDVIIDDSWRGRGLGSWLATCVREHPELQTVHRWMLSTNDAHAIYQRLGWRVVQEPHKLMEFPLS